MATTQGLKDEDHIKMDFSIKGKPHTFHIHHNRFEKTVAGIDKMIHSGRHDVDSIVRKWGHKLKGKPTPVKKPSKAEVVKSVVKNHDVEFDKAAHVKKHVDEYPSLSASAIAKTAAASSGGKLTYANAYYLAKKHQSN
jgi:hypothetical protein